MIALLVDENFHGPLLRGLLRRVPDADLVRAQDVGLAGVDDREVLEWAASEARIVLTHDFDTLAGYAFERVEAGLPMPGVFEARRAGRMRAILDDLEILIRCSKPGEWEGQVIFLPLR